MLLIIPAIFIAADALSGNSNGGETGNCASYGINHQNYNGDQGCPYEFDFSSFINNGCTLTDVDLNRNTPEIDHYRNVTNSQQWYVGNAHIQMLPNQGYGGAGFTVSFDVRVYFTDNNNNTFYEDVTWTGIVDDFQGPYPDPCY